ncbi:hypothetical protein [Streptomyces sp. NPDC001404]|uniref:hypothetical protein n=1 Tax=Streptomyces sp. NPDC001404 TaxID=3364571 RepID=UPI0036A5E74C
MTDTTTVTELRWNPPADTNALCRIPCTTADGQPAVLALDDDGRQALGTWLLHGDAGNPAQSTAFFEPRRLYHREGVIFRCEAVVPFPGNTEPRAFGYENHGTLTAPWASAIMSRRSWRRGWQDITCPAHGYECAPHARTARCQEGR